MNESRIHEAPPSALTIERGTDGFVGLYGAQSCSPEVYRVMADIGLDYAVPADDGQRYTVADLEARFPIWIVDHGPSSWARWYIHKSHFSGWALLQPAVDRAASVLRAHGYEVTIGSDFDDGAAREPGDYCEGCDDHVASDGACYCPDPEDDESCD